MSDLQTITDTLAILGLQVDYTFAADTHIGARYAEVFTEDAVLDMERAGGLGQAKGRIAIAAALDSAVVQQVASIHYTMNQRVLTIDGDRATGFAYFFQKSELKNGGRTEFYGRYDDEYERTKAGWKIRRRALVELLPTVLEGYSK